MINFHRLKTWLRSLPKTKVLWSLPFSKRLKERDISSVQQTTTAAYDLKSYNIYRSANDCPFKIFEDCIVEADYSGLAKGGEKYAEALLNEAYTAIYSDYCELADDGSGIGRLQQVGEIKSLAARINRLKMLCSMAYELGFEAIFECLRDSGFKKCREVKHLPQVIAEIKSEEIRFQIMLKNLPATEGGQTITRKYFDDILASIGEHIGVVLLKENITVSTYCAYYRRLVEKVNRLNEQVHNH